MADDKPRKLVVKKVGVGDPTFFIEFKLEDENVDANEMQSASIGIQIGEEPNIVLKTGFGTLFPLNTDIKVMGQFLGSETNVPDDIPAVVSILVNSFEDDVKKSTGTEIYYNSIEKLQPRNINLGLHQVVGLDARGGQGTKAFLVNSAPLYDYDVNLYVTEFFVSSNRANLWTIEQNESYRSFYRIVQRMPEGVSDYPKYLAMQGKEVVLVGESEIKSTSIDWQFEKQDDGVVYSIKNAATNLYLAADQTTGLVPSSTTPFAWYLHFMDQ